MDKMIVKIKRGVKQGGVLSPKIFHLFINDLIEEIERMGYGGAILDKKNSNNGGSAMLPYW